MKLRFNFKFVGIILFPVFTFFIFEPLVLYMTNINELWFGVKDFIGIAIAISVFVSIIIFVFHLFLPKNVATVLLGVLFAFGLALYIQGQILPNDYGLLDGDTIDWSRYAIRGFVNTIFWIIIFGGVFLLKYFSKKHFIKIISTASFVFLLYELLILAMLSFSTKRTEENVAYLSSAGLYEVSKDRNTIVLCMDAFDAQVFEQMMLKYPDDADFLDGFVYYPDTVGGATRTRYAIPYIMSAFAYKDPISYVEYKKLAFDSSPLMKSLAENNIDSAIYDENAYIDLTQTKSIGNIKAEKMKPKSYVGLAKDFQKMAAFRCFPHFLKRFVWLYSGELGKWKNAKDSAPYTGNDDVNFYKILQEQKLKVNDSRNVFKFIHFTGDHAPWTMNENVQRVSINETSEVQQAQGCFKIIEEYLAQLNALGVYDKSTVILMSDHGCDRGIEQNPMFLVKPAGKRGVFKRSEFPISFKNLQEIFIAGLHGDSEYPDEYVEKCEPRYFYVGSGLVGVTEYIIDGKAYDSKSIKNTGNVYSGNSFEQEEDFKKYKLGELLSFEEDVTGNMYAKSGISSPEMTHTWLVDDETVFRFTLDGNIANLKLSFNASGNDAQRVSVYANGNMVLNTVKNGSYFETVIPKTFIERDKRLELVIVHPDGYSPASRGISGDKRVMSLAMHSMKIENTKEKFAKGLALGDREFVEMPVNKKNSDFKDFYVSGLDNFQKDSDGNFVATSNGYYTRFKIRAQEKQPLPYDVILKFQDLTTFEITKIYPLYVIVNGERQALKISEDSLSFNIPANVLRESDADIMIFYPHKESATFSRIALERKNPLLLQDEIVGDFSEKGNFPAFLPSGWNGQERNGVWSAKNSKIMIMAETNSNVSMTVDSGHLSGDIPTEIFANGKFICVMSNEPSQKIMIPKSVLNDDGIQEIEFRTNDAATPLQLGKNNDARTLGVYVRKIVFKKEKVYELESGISFKKDDNSASPHIVSGFSNAEPWGTWTDGNEAKLIFRLGEIISDGLLLSLEYSTYHKQHIALYANNTKIDEWEKEGGETRKIAIPAGVVKSDSVLELRFELPEANSPKNNGESGDARMLALAFNSLTISKQELAQ